MFAIATFIYNLWSNIWPKRVIFEDMAKKLILLHTAAHDFDDSELFVQKGCSNLSHVTIRFQGPHFAMDSSLDDVKRSLFYLSTI